MKTKVVMGVHLPESDTHFAEHLLKGPVFNGFGTYQHKKLQLVLPLIKRRNVALDIGAHVGLWSQPLAHYFRQVQAFEPVPALAMCWELNLARFPNAHLHRCALGNREEDITLTYTPDNSGNTHVTCSDHGGERVLARSVRLDTIFAEESTQPPLDFIKIDTEGYEHDILLGGERLVRRHKPVILVEQKPGNAERYGLARTEAVSLLHRWGYATVWERSGDFALVHK